MKSVLICVILWVSSSALAVEKTEKVFDEIIDDVLLHYQDALGKELAVQKDWSDDGLAVTPRDKGAYFSLYIAGGIFRLKSITPDAFALIVCHELGHFAGGAPVYADSAVTPEERHLSGEGQADYWASSKCFRRIFSKKNNIKFMNDFRRDNGKRFVFKELLPALKEKCEDAWLDSASAALCERTVVAGRSYARTARIHGNEKYWVNITTPSPVVAPHTNLFHPPAQCRFDTYVAGALCDIPHTVPVSFKNSEDGVCTRSKGYVEAARPLCWYRPAIVD